MSAFVVAARRGDLARVQELLPGEGDERRRVWALRGAIQNGHLPVVEFLFAAGVPPDHDPSSPGYQPLHAAVHADNPRTVALLLEAGAQTDVFDYHGDSPLSCAQSVPVARLLLDAGADVNARRWPPLCQAAFQVQEAVLRELLAHPGVDVNRVDPVYMRSPLLWAVHGGSPVCVAALLAAGADPCALDGQRRTPLALTRVLKPDGTDPVPNPPVITLLVGAGARQWAYVPAPCPGLEAALVPVWKSATEETAPQELTQLFRRLEPAVQERVRGALRALHRGGLPEPLRMAVLGMVLG